MTRSAKNWIFSPLAIVCGALLGFWIAQDAVTKIRAASEQDPPVPSRSGRLIDRPNPPGKSSSYWDGRKRPSIEDLLLGMPHERVLRFGSDDDYRRFLGSLSGSGVRLLGQMDRFRAARVGFDDLADLEGLLADNDQIEGNFLVSIPRLPDIEAQPGALPFGSATLEWLGITTDNSAWGEGIKIAILDTGVSPHAAFPEGIREIDLVTSEDPVPLHGHGTAVASQIIGRHGATPGVAPSAELLSIRIADQNGSSNSFLLAEGITRAVDEGAQIINISMGSYGDSALVRDAVQYAVAEGAVVVAAAGNEGLDRPAYPAALDEVLAVGAVDAAGEVLDFSNRGSTLDLTAPGFSLNAAWLDDEFVLFSGTSASAPIVSAALAAAASEFAPLPVESARGLVLDYLNAAGAPGDDPEYGRGVLDLGRVMNSETGGIYDGAVASNYYVGPTSEEPVGRLQVTVENRGTEMLPNSRLDVMMGESNFPLTIPSLRPGDTRVLTIPFNVPSRSDSIPIRSTLTVGGNIVDIKPSNDVLAGEIALAPQNPPNP